MNRTRHDDEPDVEDAPAATDSARQLDRNSPMPLWAQLHDDLSRRLTLGEFDRAFPGELDLVSEYAVSRHTVREALRRLRDRGVLDTARGRATQVRRRIEQPLGSLYSLFREVENLGMVQASVVLRQAIVTDPTAAGQLDLADETELFHLERVRLADGEPLAHDRVWLPAEPVRSLLETDFARTSLYEELAARCGIALTDGSERISAATPTGDERRLLAMPQGTACLRIQRLGRHANTLLEVRDTLIRGDRYSLVAGWSSNGYSIAAAARTPQPRPSHHTESATSTHGQY